MWKYVSVDEMIAVEKEADKNGHSYADMMERAGKGLAEIIHRRFANLEQKRVLGLVGTGNNGGDTLVALCYLKGWGWEVAAYEIKARPEDDPLVQRYQNAKGYIIKAEDDKRRQKLSKALEAHAVLLDGIFGTGIHLPLRGDIPKTMEYIRSKIADNPNLIHVVAVDCPSGVDSDSGEAAAECLPAQLTVTMAAVKQGLMKFPAFDLLGELEVVDIGLPKGLDSWELVNRFVVDREFVADNLPPRPNDSHKGTYGTTLVVAGSVNYTGAARLAGESAYRIGSGLVTMAVVAPVHRMLAGTFLEATWVILPDEMGVIASEAVKVLTKHTGNASAIVLGPGLGLEDTTRKFIENLLVEKHSSPNQIGFLSSPAKKSDEISEMELPTMVVDADGLKLLVKIEDWEEHLPAKSVLTPHPGEMAEMCKLDTSEIQADRLGVAERYANEWGHIVVLKGAHTVIASPDGRTAIIPVATSALAKAGSGDILSGVIAGLIAQGMSAYEAACCGTWIHAQAGLIAAELLGSTRTVLARDVMDSLIEVAALL